MGDAEFVQTLLNIFAEEIIDVDRNAMLCKQEFERLCCNPEAIRVLVEVGVDVLSLVDFMDFIFEELSVDQEISFTDLFKVVLQLRGTNTATVKDMVDMRRFVHTHFLAVQSQIEGLL